MEFDEIYQLYFKDVYLYMKGLSSNEHIAEEITQETFVKALKAIDTFDGSKDIRAWLFTIAKNTYFSYCKKSKICTKEFQSVEMPNTSISVIDGMIKEEDAFLIHRYLHRMEEPYKEVFLLRVFGELSFEKIGKIFEKREGWARVTFHRAKKKVTKYMEETSHEGDKL